METPERYDYQQQEDEQMQQDIARMRADTVALLRRAAKREQPEVVYSACFTSGISVSEVLNRESHE